MSKKISATSFSSSYTIANTDKYAAIRILADRRPILSCDDRGADAVSAFEIIIAGLIGDDDTGDSTLVPEGVTSYFLHDIAAYFPNIVVSTEYDDDTLLDEFNSFSTIDEFSIDDIEALCLYLRNDPDLGDAADIAMGYDDEE